jgi:hypothetical protein
VDIAELEVIVAKIRFVHFELVRVDVIGEDHFPAVLLQGEPDQPNSGEELGGSKGLTPERFTAGRVCDEG